MIPPMYGLLIAVLNKAGHDDTRKKWRFDGDLLQMSAQKEFLRGYGIDVGQSDVYPVVYSEEDFKRSLELIWAGRVEGFWHYKAKYIEYGICTSEQFDEKLNARCEASQT